MHRTPTLSLLSIAATGALSLIGSFPAAAQEEVVRIRISHEGGAITATLDGNTAARDFAAMLPLALTLEDYAATEKIADLPARPGTEGAPDGYEPKAGDIAFYAPWGNLAIFHRDFRYSPGLVRLGRIEKGLDVLARPGSLKVTISRSPAAANE